jgi:hypothetical protein
MTCSLRNRRAGRHGSVCIHARFISLQPPLNRSENFVVCHAMAANFRVSRVERWLSKTNCRMAQARSRERIGRRRRRLPVALKMALQMAGAITATMGSPMPEGASVLGTICTSISGASFMRIIS